MNQPRQFPTKQLTVGELVSQGAFVIPSSQREYCWQERQVRQLCDDALEHMDRCAATPRYYRLPDMAWHRTNDSIHIYDGQQRTTTLVIMHAAVLALLNDAIKDQSFAMLSPDDQSRAANSAAALRNVVCITALNKPPAPRLTDQFEESTTQLTAITTHALHGTPLRVKGMYVSAFHDINSWLIEHFAGSPAAISIQALDFLSFLSDWMFVDVLEVETEREGWEAFNRANNRGSSPTEADRLKHYLFGNTASSRSTEMIRAWNEMVSFTRLKEMDLDRTIAAVLSSRHISSTVKNISASQIFEHVRPGGVAHQSAADGVSLATILHDGAYDLAILKSGTGRHGAVGALEVLTSTYGSITDQALPLFLAGWHLPADAFNEFANDMMRCLIVHKSIEELPSAFTKFRAGLTPYVRNLKDLASVTDPASAYRLAVELFISERAEKWALFMTSCSIAKETIGTSSEVEHKRVRSQERLARTILGLIEDSLTAEATSTKLNLEGFAARYHSTRENPARATLEHIAPESIDAITAEASFNGPEAAAALTQMLGNLTWLTTDENSKAKDHDFATKCAHYNAYRLAAAIHTPHSSQSPTHSALAPFAAWDHAAILKRQEQLHQAICSALKIPRAVRAASLPSVRADKLGFALVQADSPRLLIQLGQAIFRGASNRELRKLVHDANLDPDRQLGYYAAALAELGLVQRSRRTLTPEPSYANVFPTEDKFAALVLAHPASAMIEAQGEEKFRQLVQEGSRYAEQTAMRRSASHVSLHRWASLVLAAQPS